MELSDDGKKSETGRLYLGGKERLNPGTQIRKLKIIHKPWFVLMAVASTAALKFILMDWLHWRAFYIAGITLFWLVYIIYLEKERKEKKQNLAFSPDHFRKSLLLLSPFILLSITAILLYAGQHEYLSFKWQMVPVLLLYPIWGVIQQYLMLGIIAENLITLLGTNFNRRLVILIIPLLFSLVHFPSPVLMIFVFFMEMVFMAVYLKWKNILAIGIAHGWIATFLLYYVMQRDLWSELFSLT